MHSFILLYLLLPCLGAVHQHTNENLVSYNHLEGIQQIPLGSVLAFRNKPTFGAGYDDNSPLSDQDRERKARITQAFGDALAIADAALTALQDANEHPKFRTYFGVKGYNSRIRSVYQKLFDSNLKTRSTFYTDNIIFMKEDIEKRCGDPDLLGYNTRQGDDRERYRSRIVLCEQTWKFVDLQGSDKCGAIGSTVDQDKMDNLGRIILHEMIHHPPIGVDSNVQTLITDVKIDDRKFYGVCRVRDLAKMETSRVFGEAEINSDNYAWFAQEVYFAKLCKKTYAEPSLFSNCLIM